MSKLIVFLVLLFIVGLGTGTTLSSDSSSNFQLSITFPSSAFCVLGGTYNSIEVPLSSTLNNSLTAIVFGVFHNLIGQTLEVSTESISVIGASNVTAYLVVNLPYGNYTINVFVW